MQEEPAQLQHATASLIDVDMEDWMLQECVSCASYALHKFNDEQAVSEFMKNEFDLKYEPSWHVVVGQSFGSSIGYDIRKRAFFSIGNLYFLIYKSPEPEVPYTG